MWFFSQPPTPALARGRQWRQPWGRRGRENISSFQWGHQVWGRSQVGPPVQDGVASLQSRVGQGLGQEGDARSVRGHVGGEDHLVFPEASKVYFQGSFHMKWR